MIFIINFIIKKFVILKYQLTEKTCNIYYKKMKKLIQKYVTDYELNKIYINDKNTKFKLMAEINENKRTRYDIEFYVCNPKLPRDHPNYCVKRECNSSEDFKTLCPLGSIVRLVVQNNFKPYQMTTENTENTNHLKTLPLVIHMMEIIPPVAKDDMNNKNNYNNYNNYINYFWHENYNNFNRNNKEYNQSEKNDESTLCDNDYCIGCDGYYSDDNCDGDDYYSDGNDNIILS